MADNICLLLISRRVMEFVMANNITSLTSPRVIELDIAVIIFSALHIVTILLLLLLLARFLACSGSSLRAVTFL